MASQKSVSNSLRSIWTKLELDIRSYTLIFKGALAPTLALALFQWTAYAEYFIGTGYLVVIISILALPHLPRAKFIETTFMSVLFTCIGAATSLLAIYCAVKARGDGATTNSDSAAALGQGNPANYDGSASAVIGVWLFVQIYIIGAVKASKPQWSMPCVIWSVYVNVAMAYGPQITTVEGAEAFTKLLLSSCLTGFAISAIVSVLVFPLTNRQLVFQDMTSYVSLLRKACKMSLESVEVLEQKGKELRSSQEISENEENSHNQLMQESLRLSALGDKMNGDLAFARKEMAIGKMAALDIEECCRLLRRIRLPMIGLGSLSDILRHVREKNHRIVDTTATANPHTAQDSEKGRIAPGSDWHNPMKELQRSLEIIVKSIDEGLEHVLLVLQLETSRTARRSRDADMEADGASAPQPGASNFTKHFSATLNGLANNKEMIVREWRESYSIDCGNNTSDSRDLPRQQLFEFVYLEFLLLTVSRRLVDLMIFVDDLERCGRLRKTRLIVPDFRPFWKWLIGLVFLKELLSDGSKNHKDPEHLPPADAWESFGDRLREISHFLASPASQFGFRVALGTIAVALVDYFSYSQSWFISNRLFWAQIMIAIGMNPTSGQGFRTFFMRVVFSMAAYVAALIAWYIVDGKTAGVIVMFFVVIHPFVYVVLKTHAVAVFGLVAQAAFCIIVGYELQARKLGHKEATSNGQSYYRIYLLGAIRLADVAAGLFVAWFFTIFPYPIAEHNQIRVNLGRALQSLAGYYSMTHATLRLHLHSTAELGDAHVMDGSDGRLDLSRTKAWSQVNALVQGLQTQSKFLKWEIPVGGKFPTKQYQELTSLIQGCLYCMSLVSLASNDLAHSDSSIEWLDEFRAAVGGTGTASEQVTSLLSLLSAAINGGYALPPFLHVPQPWLLGDGVKVSPDIMDVRHIVEPGYASFVIVLLATEYVHDNLKRLVAGVKNLVGELDFLYQLKDD